MKTYKLLHNDWGYPVCQHPEGLQKNIDQVFNFLAGNNHYKRVQFTGIGTSGAMLLAGLSSRCNLDCLFSYVLLRKDNDNTAQGRNYIEFKNLPIVIIDDHLSSCNTLRNVYQKLADLKVKKYVVGVVAKCWDDADLSYFDTHQTIIKGLFPSIKFWIH